MYAIKAARQTKAFELDTYNWEDGALPRTGYWLFRNLDAIGWYASMEAACQRIYDEGYNAGIKRI